MELSCPQWLTKEARREWRRVVKHLKAANLATAVDRTVLAAYCQSYARWRQAEEALSAKGLVMEIETEKGGTYAQQRPEVSIAQKYQQLMLQAAGKLGFDPSSRSRIVVPVQEAADPLAEFLQRKKADGG